MYEHFNSIYEVKKINAPVKDMCVCIVFFSARLLSAGPTLWQCYVTHCVSGKVNIWWEELGKWLMIMFRKCTKISPEQRACTHRSNGGKIIIYVQVTNSLVRLE